MAQETNAASQVYKWLQGKWLAQRTFENNRNSDIGHRAEGYVEIKEKAGSLSYGESFKLHLSDGSTTTGRMSYKFKVIDGVIYQYRDSQINGTEEEPPMFQLIFVNKNGELFSGGDYKCGTDDYHVTYTFHDNDRFCVVYTANGRGKDFATYTEFTRIPEEDEAVIIAGEALEAAQEI